MSYRALLFSFLQRHLSPYGFKKRSKFLELRGEDAVITVGIDHARERWYVDVGVVLTELNDREISRIPLADMAFRLEELFESRHIDLYPLCEERTGVIALQSPELASLFEREIAPWLSSISQLDTLKRLLGPHLQTKGLVTWQAVEFLRKP